MAKTEVEIPSMSWVELLTEAPPNKLILCNDALIPDHGHDYDIKEPEIWLWCSDESCKQSMLYEFIEIQGGSIDNRDMNYRYIVYKCKHCDHSIKTFSVLIFFKGSIGWQVIKLGESPPYGPHIPPRVLKLVKEDIEYFRQGHRAERLNLGIGAFAYYRRVVENQKDRLFDKIISVAEKLKSDEALIDQLRNAKANFQFKKSVEDFKDAIPPSLLINGHNPLLLLHNALSKGLHNQSDTECLNLAKNIRIVLTELADRVSQAIKVDAELNEAVNKLTIK